MLEKIKNMGWSILGLGILILMTLIILLFIRGGVWAADNILPWLAPVMWLVLAVDIVVLLPLAIFRKTRGYASIGLYFSSYIFGLTLWLQGLLLAYFLWGLGAVFIGLILAGIGVVPIAMLATLFNGEWALLGLLVLFTAITFGARFLGTYFGEQEE